VSAAEILIGAAIACVVSVGIGLLFTHILRMWDNVG